MNKLSHIRYIVFDLDGTLLDTLYDLADSVNFALEKNGYPVRSYNEIRLRIGNGVRNLVSRSLPQEAPEEAVDKALADFRAHYAQNLDNKTRPYGEIPALLQALSERGIQMAVNSNKYDKAVKHLRDRFLSPAVTVAVGELEGVPKKPAPDSVLYTMELMGADREHTLYVGDSEVDVMTAQNAGLSFVGCAWGLRGAEALREAGAEIVLDSPLELLDVL